MKPLYCAQLENNRLSLRTVSGARPERLRRNALILVSRLDCDLRVLDVPPLPAREIRAFVRYRLRTLYPGDPDDTLFDFRLTGEGEKRRAVVYLMRRKTMEHYRRYADHGRLVAADQLLIAVLGKGREGSVLFVREAYVEYLRYAGGELRESAMVLVDAHLELPAVCRRDQKEPAQASNGTPVWVAERRDDPRLESVFGEKSRVQRRAVRSLEEVLAGIRIPPWERSRMGLFRVRRLPPASSPFAALALALLTLAFAAWHVRSIVERYEWRYEVVRSAYLRYQELVENNDGSSRKLNELRARYRALAGRRPVDTYRLLRSLSDAVTDLSGEPRTTIDALTLSGTALTVEGSTADPFRLAEALSSRHGFSRVRIIQAIPAGEGRTARFTVTGHYDDR